MSEFDLHLVTAGAEILGDASFGEAEIEARVAALAPDALTARRLIDVIPEAFGLVTLAHLSHLGAATISENSVTVRLVNQTLNVGGCLDGAAFGVLKLLGVPWEFYEWAGQVS